MNHGDNYGRKNELSDHIFSRTAHSDWMWNPWIRLDLEDSYFIRELNIFVHGNQQILDFAIRIGKWFWHDIIRCLWADFVLNATDRPGTWQRVGLWGDLIDFHKFYAKKVFYKDIHNHLTRGQPCENFGKLAFMHYRKTHSWSPIY